MCQALFKELVFTGELSSEGAHILTRAERQQPEIFPDKDELLRDCRDE